MTNVTRMGASVAAAVPEPSEGNPPACGTGRLRHGTLMAYALGSVGAGIYSTVPAILLLYFLTEQLRVPASVAALVVLLPKLVIIVFDPVVGAWSDRTSSRWGRRAPFLLIGALVSAAAFVVLFHVKALATVTATATVATLAYLSSAMAFSVFAVPYVTMPAELGDSVDERARLVGWRMCCVFAGVLVGAALPPLLISALGGGSVGYGNMAFVIAAIALACMLPVVFVAASHSHVGYSRDVALSPRVRFELRQLLGKGAYAAALAVYIVSMAASGAYAAAAPYFIQGYLARGSSGLSLFFLVQIGASLIAMLPWTAWVRRGKHVPALAISVVLMIAGCQCLWSMRPQSAALALYGGALLGGVGTAGVQVAAFALLADLVRAEAKRTGQAREGLLTGLWTAGERLGLALGPTICALSLAAAARVPLIGTAAEAPRAAIVLAPTAVLVLAGVGLFAVAGRLRTVRPAIGQGTEHGPSREGSA